MTRQPITIGVGVIGAGRFGENHVRAYAESPLCRLIAIADTDPVRLDYVARKYSVQYAYTDYHRLLDHPEIEAVSIATPAHLHMAPALASANSGKHILLEKPIAPSLSEAREITQAVDTNHVKLMIGHILRFENRCAATYAALKEGLMGPPVAIVSRFNNPITEARYSGAQISPILHLMIHHIDLTLWYMNQFPVSVFCAAARGKVFADLGVIDGCVLTMNFSTGALGITESFWCLPKSFGDWGRTVPWQPIITDRQIEIIGASSNQFERSTFLIRRFTGWY